MVDLGDDRDLVELAGEVGPVSEGNDGEEFRKAVKEDESLREWRELGDKQERGFSWKGGTLVKSMYVTWDEFRDVLVVPKEWRGGVLTIAHEKTGHLGVDKVLAMVSKHFLWPGMQRDISAHCRGCVICQRKSKYKPKRAPVVERPVLSEPFEDVAVDIVGPLEKGKGGCLC